MLPANFIECSDKKAAAKMVLLYSSIYAKITNEGLGEFLDDFELDISNLINEIDLPGLDFDSILEPEALPEDIDEAPQPLEKTYSILGDVFEIDGKHRVMCGDSTKESDVSILMNGNKADVVVTDPPYNTGMTGKPNNEKARLSHMFNDNIQDWDKFLTDIFTNYFKNTKGDCAYYVFIDWRRVGDVRSKIESLMSVKNVIVWDKKVHGLGSDYKSTYELIIVGKKGNPEIQNRYGLDYQDIWRLQREMGRNKDHATVKPIELCQKPIKHASKTDDIVLDLFLGSGSTLIAAETTKRICYGMEIDQHYSDVILRRYKKTFPNASFKCLTRNDFPFEELFNA